MKYIYNTNSTYNFMQRKLSLQNHMPNRTDTQPQGRQRHAAEVHGGGEGKAL